MEREVEAFFRPAPAKHAARNWRGRNDKGEGPPWNGSGGRRLREWALSAFSGGLVSARENTRPRRARSGSRNAIAAYQLDAMSTGAIDDSVWAGNWKLTMENALDSYHHMGLHEKSLQADMPGLGTEFQGDYGTWAHHHTPFSERFASEVAQTVPQSTAKLRPADRTKMNVFYIYPSFVMPLLPLYANWLSIMPVDLGETRVLTGLLLSDEYRKASGADEQALATQSLDSLRAINAEDRQATDRLQLSTQSRFIERGLMSRKEIGVLHFYRYLARKLL